MPTSFLNELIDEDILLVSSKYNYYNNISTVKEKTKAMVLKANIGAPIRFPLVARGAARQQV